MTTRRAQAQAAAILATTPDPPAFGPVPDVQPAIASYTIPGSQPGTSYRVTISRSGVVRCCCPASIYQPGKLCRHGRRAAELHAQEATA